MSQPSDLLGPLRVPFLLLPPACVAAGAGAAFWRTGRIDWGTALLVLVGAVCAHASVNALNEYSDFRTGIDAQTRRTPFSGGSGTLQRRPELAGYTLGVGLGLALARTLVEMHHGRIWMTSKGLPGEGSTFSFTLPTFKNDEA